MLTIAVALLCCWLRGLQASSLGTRPGAWLSSGAAHWWVEGMGLVGPVRRPRETKESISSTNTTHSLSTESDGGGAPHHYRRLFCRGSTCVGGAHGVGLARPPSITCKDIHQYRLVNATVCLSVCLSLTSRSLTQLFSHLAFDLEPDASHTDSLTLPPS